MRHKKKINHLSRTASHRNAMLSNMASSLILHKRINTTLAKAKALRGYVEPLITKSKDDTTHSRRMVYSYLQNKEAVSELFREVSQKVADRPGGYTRIIKTGFRLGDNAEMCMMELVDYNELLTKDDSKKKTRRSRRGGKKSSDTAATTPATEAPAKEEVKAEEPKAEVVEEVAAPEVEETKVEAKEEVATAEVEETPTKEEPKAEEPAAEEAKADEAAAPEAEAKSEDAPEAKAEEEKKEDNNEGEEEKKSE